MTRGGQRGRVDGSYRALLSALDVDPVDRAKVVTLGVALCDAAAGLPADDYRRPAFDRLGAAAGAWAYFDAPDDHAALMLAARAARLTVRAYTSNIESEID